MKVIIADFKIAKYGGIVEYTAAMLKAFKELGCDVDIVQIHPKPITEREYNKKVSDIVSGDYDKRIQYNSEWASYQKDETVGYYRNPYHGYYLPPSRRICAYEKEAVRKWFDLVSDADIILWNFMPTKLRYWVEGGKKLNFWHKFFDLPDRIKQVFLVHDAYFNVRASNIIAVKDKILFLGCAHLAAYYCCSEIGMPRTLLFNPRYIADDAKMPIKLKDDRKVDFFAAHMFKPMKHMEEYVAAIPYVNSVCEIAGAGIEYSYMTSVNKIKQNYLCTKKRDGKLPDEMDGKISLWNRAVDSGMIYHGQMSGEAVIKKLKNTKFAIDPSYCKHYANYCNTHINGFIIEAMLCGAYPVLRDYRGLAKNDTDIYDPLFENIRAVFIPWNASPSEFADILNSSIKNISTKKFIKDTKHNFELVREFFNAKRNAKEIINLCKNSKKKIKDVLQCGHDSESVKKICNEMMSDFFDIELPIEWEN